MTMTKSRNSRHRVKALVRRVALALLPAIGLVCGGVGHAHAAPFAYVASRGPGMVSVIDVEANTVVATISLPSGSYPHSVVVTPDGERVYVTSQMFKFVGIVSVIDTATNRVLVPEIEVGFGASGLAVTPDGRFVYVASSGAGRVSVIDTTSNRVVAAIFTDFPPTDVAATPDRSRVYVAGLGASVAVIDTSNNTVVNSIGVAANSYEIVLSPDGSKVYVSSLDSHTVSVIEAGSDTVASTIPVGLSPLGMAVTPDGTRLYVVDHDPLLNNGSIAVVDTATNTLLTRVTLPLSQSAGWIALTPNGAHAYVTINTPQQVLVVDTATNVVVGDPIPSDGTPGGIAITPPPTGGLLPPIGLYASSIVGNQVTLRWTPRTTTVNPTGYVLEGGINPGEVLATIPTGSTTPSFTFTAPTGAFYVRIHTLAGTERSAASNEIPIFVNAPAAPSAPANLLGMVNGSSLSLAWRNTYGGGTPTALWLDVGGSLVGGLPLPIADTVTFVGVPPGVFVLKLRAVNPTGTSASSNAVMLTTPIFPACSGSPHVPVNFLATRIGNAISATWDSPDSGPAPTGFVLVVSGAFDGEIPLMTRSISATVGSGSYTLSVYATNSCGAGPKTATQAVVIPLP